MGIVGGFADVHGELAGVHFDVLVADQVAHFQVAGKHAHIKMRGLRHFDLDLEIVVRTVGDADLRQGLACHNFDPDV